MVSVKDPVEPARSSPDSFPSPADRPQADIVVYDGNCQFCLRQVDRLHRLDSKGRLAFLSLHDPAVAELCPNLSHDDLMKQMYVLDKKGQQHGGAAAIRYLSRKLPRLWPAVPLLYMPFCFPIWQWLYRQVANRRYRFNAKDCENGACRVHLR
jgi:predicted DCC family thiol-disulfide oxidoreductase YuxK